MEGDPDPDPLRSFLVPPVSTPTQPRSAPPSAPRIHQTPDPKSVTPDPPIEGLLPHAHAVAREIEGEERPVNGVPESPVSAALSPEEVPALDASPSSGQLVRTASPAPLIQAQEVLPSPTPRSGAHDGQEHSTLSSAGAGASSMPGHPELLHESAALELEGQKHSTLNEPSAASEGPSSPTVIDPEIQAQGWAILPELAQDLNLKLSRQGAQATINNSSGEGQQPGGREATEGSKHAVDTSSESQEEIIQRVLLQSRIPASQKGKRVQTEEGIHGARPAPNLKPVAPSTQMIQSQLGDSTPPPWGHKTDEEEGWEPAKLHRRKRQDPEGFSKQFTSLRDTTMGSTFFRSKLEGKCFNCFSPNHLAHSCHRSPRCWRCNHSGHKAIDCPRRRDYKRSQEKQSNHHIITHQNSGQPKASQEQRVGTRSFAEVVKGEGGMATPRYPGDPRARPARAYCAVSATGAIRQRRDELYSRAATCKVPGNSHDTEPHHLGNALRRHLNIHHDDVQILKHYPEQFLVIFNNPRDRERVIDVAVLPDNGRTFQFARWNELRSATITEWEFRVRVRIEGVPLHCWAEDVAARAIGRSCTIHYLEETTRKRQRSRSFDLWAWCHDPCDIPAEVVLTVTNPDRGYPHQDDPEDLKRGQVYVLRNHLEVVEDLSFLRTPGRLPGPSDRKARRVFDWDYGVPDFKGERRERDRGQDRGRDFRPRREDDEDGGDRHHGIRRQRSLSAWARDSRCRGGAQDCISSTKRRLGAPSYKSRQADGAPRSVQQVWRVKEMKKNKVTKRVSFADPIATKLKPKKKPITDDSILLIMDTNRDGPQMGNEERDIIHDMTEEEQMNKESAAGGEGTEKKTMEVDMSVQEKDVEDEQMDMESAAGGEGPDKKTTEVDMAVQEKHIEQETTMEEQLGLALGHLQELLHFARPVEKVKMDAIQCIIEQETGNKLIDANVLAVGEANGLAA